MKIRSILAAICLCMSLPAYVNALTVEEILLLKQNGVSEQTIRLMIASEMQAEQNRAAESEMGVRTIMRPGGQPAIVYSTGSSGADTRNPEERLREERAWDMLRHIIVDARRSEAGSRRSAD
ncbi:MAG: hypothetical protein WBY88_02625 [Desulfosarcina sp.]